MLYLNNSDVNIKILKGLFVLIWQLKGVTFFSLLICLKKLKLLSFTNISYYFLFIFVSN